MAERQDANTAEPGLFGRSFELCRVVPAERRGDELCKLRRRGRTQRTVKCGEDFVALDLRPDGDVSAPAFPEHAKHLAQGGRTIGKELQSLLAHHDVERIAWRCQRRSP